jgi:hypothetical protein
MDHEIFQLTYMKIIIGTGAGIYCSKEKLLLSTLHLDFQILPPAFDS